MTKILKCKDIEGLNRKCPFEWRGHSEDEVVDKAAERITSWHRPQNFQEILWRARKRGPGRTVSFRTRRGYRLIRLREIRRTGGDIPSIPMHLAYVKDSGTKKQREYMARILTLQTTGSQCGQPTGLVGAAGVSGYELADSNRR